MRAQLRALHHVLVHPRATFLSLPSNRLYVLGIFGPLYCGVARAFRSRTYEVLHGWLGGNLQVALFAAAVGLVMIPLGAWLIRQGLRLFQKRLSIIKLMNIYGYALVPRLIVAGVGYLTLFSHRTLFVAEQPSVGLIVLTLLGLAASIYTLVLYVYGIVVCPSEDR